MTGYFLPEQIMGMLLNYLVTKPYFEVTKLINELQSLPVVGGQEKKDFAAEKLEDVD